MPVINRGLTIFIIICFCSTCAISDILMSSWGDWTEWSQCTVTCGYGARVKTKYWFDEDGEKTNETYVIHASCYLDIKCPIDGNWTMWPPYSACSAPCGPGIRTRTRTCTNPRPASGGMDCLGAGSQQTNCNLGDCPPLPANFDLESCKIGNKFMCTSKRMCIENDERCDRVVQCHDGSDEYLCYKYSSGNFVSKSSWTMWIVSAILCMVVTGAYRDVISLL